MKLSQTVNLMKIEIKKAVTLQMKTRPTPAATLQMKIEKTVATLQMRNTEMI